MTLHDNEDLASRNMSVAPETLASQLEEAQRLLALYQEQLLTQDRYLEHERREKKRRSKTAEEHLQQRDRQIEDLTRYAAYLERWMEDMLQSTSWQVTAPLRQLIRTLRRIDPPPKFEPRFDCDER